MSYCLNPSCPKPQNLEGSNAAIAPPYYCISCGSKLLLNNRYRAVKPIGQGGMGRTFLAVDEGRFKASCAIKQFLPSSQIQGNSEAMIKATQLFEQEARHLLELGEQHSQIPTLLDYFEQDRRLYLVQQLIEGQDLWQELETQGAFSEEKIWQVLTDLLPVLQFVHDRQVIHRDIKPTNILRRSPSKSSQLVLIDFGVAKQVTSSSLEKTGTRGIGTFGYAPVEQLRGGKAYPASDLYSLGVTCIHLLTKAELDNLFDPLEGCWLWRSHLQKQGREVSDRLGKILDKMIREWVSDRYQAANEVLKDLNLGTPASVSPLPEGASLSHISILKSNQSIKPAVKSKLQNPKSKIEQTWRCVQTIAGHPAAVNAIAISPDGQTLATGRQNGTIRLWQLETGVQRPHGAYLRCALSRRSGWVSCLAFSPDGQILASDNLDKTIELWQLSTGKKLRVLKGHSDWVNAIAIGSRDGLLASASSDNTIGLWQIDDGRKVATLKGHSDAVRSLAISFDGEIIASGSGDNTIKLWQITGGHPQVAIADTLTAHSDIVYCLAFSRNRSILASGSRDNAIALWQLGKNKQGCPSGSLLRILSGHSGSVNSVAFSPQGSTLATGSDDNTIKIWQQETGNLLCTLTGHSAAVTTLAFSPDGWILASGSLDQTIKIWWLSP